MYLPVIFIFYSLARGIVSFWGWASVRDILRACRRVLGTSLQTNWRVDSFEILHEVNDPEYYVHLLFLFFFFFTSLWYSVWRCCGPAYFISMQFLYLKSKFLQSSSEIENVCINICVNTDCELSIFNYFYCYYRLDFSLKILTFRF